MTSISRPLRRILGRPGPVADQARGAVAVPPPVAPGKPGASIDIPQTDPLFAYLQAAPGPVDLARLDLASAALDQLVAAGVALIVPLVAQGELVGTLNLGPRLSEQEFSSDDRRLLARLAAQAAPAIRVAQLVRAQAAEAAERERMGQELKVAQLIQQQFLPHELPNLPEWQVAAYYGPARVVGGDFYDFIDLDDGLIGIVVGDVTDKGVPAALVMARTHSILRAEAPRLVDPGRVLARANELLVPEMPPRMFVTCLYGVLDPASGRFRFANAGHNLPYVRTAQGVTELRATGLPLGLLPGVDYEESEGVIAAGDAVLFYSDGIVEQHGPGREMYGFPRLRAAMAGEDAGSRLIDRLLSGLRLFTGAAFEQEDDITLVTMNRSAGVADAPAPAATEVPASADAGVEFSPESRDGDTDAVASTGAGVRLTRDDPAAEAVPADARPLAAFSIAGAIGNERAAMQRVAEAVAPLGLEPARLERLKTAVAETVMNAIEYGSLGNPDIPVEVRVDADRSAVRIRVTDRALSGPVPDAEAPDLDAKLEGRQKPRGWGLFLIRHMVDGMDVHAAEGLQTVTLTLGLTPEGGAS